MIQVNSPVPVQPNCTPKVSGRPGAGPIWDTFREFVRLTVADGDASKSTVQTYAEGLKMFLGWCAVEDMEVDPLKATVSDLQQYRFDLAKTHKKATIAIRLRAVRLLYDALQRYGKRQDNPAIGLRAPRERTTRDQKVIQRSLTLEETKKLIYQFPPMQVIGGARDRAILLLLLCQGLRISEVRNMLISDVDIKTFSTIKIRGKGGKERHICLCPLVREAMINWIHYVSIRADLLHYCPVFYRLESTSLLNPKTLSTRTIERIADKYLKLAGLKRKGISAHSLRHTYAMLAVLAGAQRERIGASMGHANQSTTDIYIRAAATFQDNPADAVNNLIEGGK